MPGTIKGGIKASITNKSRYGDDYYKNIGSMGGKKSRGGGFASNHELAVKAGRKGGKKSRKPKMTATRQAELERAIQENEHKNWLERLRLR